MVEKPTLVMTVGLPGSGKSTWARRQNLPIVSPDAIRFALHGERWIALAEPFVWAIAKVMVRALFLAGHHTVLLDATNITKARRDEWQSSTWLRWFAVFRTPASVCIKRAVQRDGGDLYIVPVIDHMAEQFEMPTADEQAVILELR